MIERYRERYRECVCVCGAYITWPKQLKPCKLTTMVSCVEVTGVLSHCALFQPVCHYNAPEINQQIVLIWILLYDFKLLKNNPSIHFAKWWRCIWPQTTNQMILEMLLRFCLNGYSVHHWSGRPGFNPRSSHTKDSKIVLDITLLNTQ